MKLKSILAIFLTLGQLYILSAQPGTIYFSSETGDKFTLYVKAVRQNNIPAPQVEALNVSGSSVPCMIVFENTNLPSIYGNVERNTEDAAFVISRDSRGAVTITAKATSTTLSNGVTISGTSSSGNTTTVTTNGGYVSSVKSGSVEATDHSVKTDKFSASSNVSVKVKTPAGLGPLPTADEVNAVANPMGTYQTNTASTTTTTTTTTTSSSAQAQTVPKGVFYFESEGIDSFYLWFNDVKVNKTPQMNVVVRDVIDTYLNLRVEFSDRTYKPCSKSMIRWGRDCYYSIQRNNKGEHIIKLKNAVGDLKSPEPATTQTTTTQVQNAGGPVSTFTFTSAPVTTVSTTTTRVSVNNPSTTASVSASTPSASATVSSPAPVAAQGPLHAEMQGNKIVLSDGRKYTLNSFAGNSEAPHIKSSVLSGSKVTLTYNDGLDTYSGTFPFDYTMPKKEKFGQGVTMTVDEGGVNKTWAIKLPTSNWRWVNIEP